MKLKEESEKFGLKLNIIKTKIVASGPIQLSSVQSLSHVRLFATPWITVRQASLSITNSWSSLKLMAIESVMPSSHLILCLPLLFLPPIPPSIRVFSNESTLYMRWPKNCSFNFSIIPSKEHPGLISLEWTGWISLQAKGLSRIFSNTTVLIKNINSSALSFLHSPTSRIHTWPLGKPWREGGNSDRFLLLGL